MSKEACCKYCDKVLNDEKGEVAHGCLDCYDKPYMHKIDKLQEENEELRKMLIFLKN